MITLAVKKAGVSCAVLLCLVSGPAAGEEPADSSASKPNFPYKTITTKEGLTFRVPEDMPLEMRGGIQAPIPFDEYMYGKFETIDARLARMEERLASIEGKLDRTSPMVQAQIQKLSAQSASSSDSTGIMKAGID